jgi:acyl-CoA synthetase (AMP-forming)/AMP-acid ligase II
MSSTTVVSVWTPTEVEELYSSGYWNEKFITDYLDEWLVADPDRTFIYDGGVQLSWRELRDRSCALAGEMREIGLQSGDRVAVQLPNWNEFVVTYLALARMRAVMVPIMPVYRHREVRHVLVQSGARAYVYTPWFRNFGYEDMAEEFMESVPDLRWRLSARADPVTDCAEHSVETLIERGRGRWTVRDFENGHSEDYHLIVFTSGTESAAKGCLHTWNSYRYTPLNQMQLYEFGRDDIELVVSPITHTTGLAAGLLKPLIAGGALCMMDIWEPKAAVRIVEQIGCTQMTGATPFLAQLLEAAKELRIESSRLRVFVCGGAPVPAELVVAAKGLLGCQVCTAYGQSEALLLTSISLRDAEGEASASDGIALPGLHIAALDPEGNEVAAGEEGEICYRSPGQMLGYWNSEEADQATKLPGGWRRSGDLGRIGPDSHLRVTGRLKEMILRGGMNISAREVEDLLRSHPSVAEVAVVGLPDPVLGERVGAAIVPAEGQQIDPPRLIAYLRDECRAAKPKFPERVLVIDELPLSSTGKVLKFELIKRLAQEGAVP